MAHCTLEDLTGDWIDASAESNQHMPQPESIRNILRYSAGLRATKTSRFGTFTGLMN
ncbi:MAG: hypothetical protein ACO2ZL_05600 [Flavobacteriales bacterium]|jgi:hypothetical protein